MTVPGFLETIKHLVGGIAGAGLGYKAAELFQVSNYINQSCISILTFNVCPPTTTSEVTYCAIGVVAGALIGVAVIDQVTTKSIGGNGNF
jgi:hypothetical protein